MKEDLMLLRSVFALAAVLGGCVERNAASCVDDGKCSDPLRPFCDKLGVFGEPNMCIAVSCAPREFVACSADEAIFCDSSGTNFESEACPYGCGDAGCNPYLEPRYLPEICETPATAEEFLVSNTAALDTDLDANCTGGVLAQSGGPSICVIRYRVISIAAAGALSVSGSRAVAFVADDEITIDGVLDISANGTVDGPGGGIAISGGAAGLGNGGGGAGFQSMGGHGGTPTIMGGAMNGGPQSGDPALLSTLVGGTRSAVAEYEVESGGGGGATTIIACRGAVNVGGTLDAGGGGGQPGGSVQFACLGGSGGGSGGHIAIQGLTVSVSGQAFANGAGGGAGQPNSQTPNEAGEDGRRSVQDAAGGFCADGGYGGNGGTVFSPPRAGASGQSPGCGGGGGGSVGYLQTFTPVGAVATVTPSAASPSFRENQSLPVRTRPMKR